MSHPPLESTPPRTFAENVVAYAQAGWPCILPVPVTEKYPPPVGFTGADGRDTDPLQLVTWAGSHPAYSIALRMPATVIGIDVDSYVKAGKQKHGAETLAHYLEAWGPLPPTWISTARGDDTGPGPSGIRFYRVPAQRFATKLATAETGDVEIIQRHHRYAVVAPSPNPETGTLYRWYGPDGSPAAEPPKPEDLPELPAAWVEGLTAGATQAGPAAAGVAVGQALLDQLLDDWRPECADITSARLQALDELDRADAGSRHDTMTARVHHLIQLSAKGHTGVAAALLELRDLWAKLTAGEDRADELDRMLLTSARKAVTVVGQHQVPRDPCLLVAGGFPLPPPAEPGPVDEDGNEVDLRVFEPPRWLGPREVIGTHAFDPAAGLDQTLAEAVLERTYPALRYAYDANGWLLRAPDRWELHKRLSPWAVATLATLMPLGDPTADKDSDAYARAQRRARLMSSGGARGVAGKMDDLVSGGMHPAAVALSDLDADPEVLWAGGMPYDLRASREAPTPAQCDPAAPHLHSAGIVPERRPTPLWDAFLAAVWPDPAVRAWAMRVLSIAATGYSDRALPILLGETGRGKTQVVHLVMSVLGSYAHAANPKLLGVAAREHDTIVFALKGRRLSFIDEAPSEAKAGQERLKQLTGGGELEARQMNQDPITFRPTHTLVLTANDEPLLTDPAVRARVRLLPCEGDPEQVRAARAALGHVSGPVWRREAPGVLAQLMSEAAAWLADPSTASVAAAPEGIRYLAEHLGAEQDPTTVWVSEETEPDDVGTPSRELYQAFTASCLRNNLRRDQIPSETKWGRQLTRLGFPSVHTEHGKRRQLVVRSGGGGHVPSAPESPARRVGEPAVVWPSELEPVGSAGFLTGSADPDGLLTGSNPNPSAAKPQVNPNESVTADGLTGSGGVFTYAHTHDARGDGECTEASNPSASPSPATPKTAPDLGEQAPDGLAGEPVNDALDLGLDGPETAKPQVSPRKSVTKARKPRTAEATQRAAEKREAARLEAIAAAAGTSLPLPVVVTRDLEVRPATVVEAGRLLATITEPAAGFDAAPLPTELTVDVEHTGYPLGHRHYALRTVQLGCETFALVLDPHDPAQADVIRWHLGAAEVLHAHSASADLIPLADAGLLGPDPVAGLEDAWDRMVDTIVLAKLDDPASTGNDPGLKQLSGAMLRDYGLSKPADEARAALFKAGRWLTETKVTTPLERSGWAQVDHTCETQLRYAAADVLDDAALATRLPRPAPAILDRERLAQRMTARVAYDGLRIDGDHVEELLEAHTGKREQFADLVRALAGSLVPIENPGSNQQVGRALEHLGAVLPRTDTGKPSVAEAVLTPLARQQGPAADLARTVLRYRHHDTAIGTFLEPYQHLVRHGDGRARPTVYTLGADTGRMSCVRPNLQQVPREGGFRACITADPGYRLISVDFAGVELRVAAALSGDRNLLEILSDPNRDLHWEITRIAFGPNATKADRYAIKRGVFGRIYGGGVGAVAAGVGVSEAVAQQVIDAMDQLTPQLSEWSRLVREGVKAGRTTFPTYAGRVVHLDAAFPHKAPNYCIQGTARELLVDALVRWNQTRWGRAVLLPVHDEVVAHVPEDEALEATAVLAECMTTELHGVPIIAEASEPAFAWQDSV